MGRLEMNGKMRLISRSAITLAAESLDQLQLVYKRSCSCEAIPRDGHAWTELAFPLVTSHLHLPAVHMHVI